MRIHITAQWGATPFYDAGEHQFEVDWGYHSIPVVGNIFRLYSFIETLCEHTETFIYNGQDMNVFQFIDDEHYWKVQQMEWELKGSDLIGHLIVTDAGYFVN